MAGHGELPGEGREGEGKVEGRRGMGRGLGPCCCFGCSLLLLAVHEEEHVGKNGKRRERKGEKEKKWKIS
jgi:hypothetical protein